MQDLVVFCAFKGASDVCGILAVSNSFPFFARQWMTMFLDPAWHKNG
jgi:hypothetical protein